MSHVMVIAEAGVNHNGSLQRAVEMVDVAASAGADCIKFQTFRAPDLATADAPKAVYQKKYTPADESQLAMLSRLEIDEEGHRVLIQRCAEKKITFLSSPFDPGSLHMLTARLNLPMLKLGSGELTNAPLLLEAAQANRPLILSTGMASLDEVEEALGVLAFGYAGADALPCEDNFRSAFSGAAGQEVLQKNVTLLHCTSAYPTPDEEINLRAMLTLKEHFGLPTGFSDHSVGVEIAIGAAALGASVIEKHFTLDRNLEGPDHAASIDPDALQQLVHGVRRISRALGSGVKVQRPVEYSTAQVARKSLVAVRRIADGEVFSKDNIAVKRPGTGMAPVLYWSILGKKSPRAFAPDELITLEHSGK